jgi:hypothetical protein
VVGLRDATRPALESMGSLVEQNMLRRVGDADKPRFDLLETLR